jgi:hypothetical protein
MCAKKRQQHNLCKAEQYKNMGLVLMFKKYVEQTKPVHLRKPTNPQPMRKTH